MVNRKREEAASAKSLAIAFHFWLLASPLSQITQADRIQVENKDDFLWSELWSVYYLHSYHKSLDWKTE